MRLTYHSLSVLICKEGFIKGCGTLRVKWFWGSKSSLSLTKTCMCSIFIEEMSFYELLKINKAQRTHKAQKSLLWLKKVHKNLYLKLKELDLISVQTSKSLLCSKAHWGSKSLIIIKKSKSIKSNWLSVIFFWNFPNCISYLLHLEIIISITGVFHCTLWLI